MLKSSKSMISTTHYQLLNVIQKIKTCYQHYQRFLNDLFYRCNNNNNNNNNNNSNITTKQNKRQKRRPRNRRKHKLKTQYLNSHNSIISHSISSNKNSSSSINSTKTKRVANVCYCFAHHNECSDEVNLSYNYQVSDYLQQHIWLYFQKNFHNLQLVIVIFLLALITTAAHSIDSQEKPQQKSTTTSPSLLNASNDTLSIILTNLSASIYTNMPCYPYLSDNLHRTVDGRSLKFKTNICHNLRHIFHRHRNGQRHLQLHKRKILNQQATTTHGNNSSKWLDHNNNNHNQQIKLKSISNSDQTSIQSYYENFNNHHQPPLDDESSVLILDKQTPIFQFNTKVIKFKNNNNNNNNSMAKEHEDLRKTNNSNINKLLLQHKRTNNNNNNNNNKNNNNYNKKINKLTFKANTPNENANDINNDHIDVNVNDNDDDDDDDHIGGHVEIVNSSKPLNLLPPATTITLGTTTTITTTANDSSLQSAIERTDQPQQPHIDHSKLMKLVMDGLGLTKAPNMKTVNISQEEYVTKYREYLQRIHTRKRRELRDVRGVYDYENIFRPLEIFSIVSSNTLPSKHQEHTSYNEINLMRHKRNALVHKNLQNDERNDNVNENENEDNDNDSGSGSGRKQSLEERVKDILLLKKKYQKPRSTKKERDERKTNIRLMFALKPEILNLSSSDIEEANIRLVLIHSPILAVRNSKNKITKTKPKNTSCSLIKSDDHKNRKQVNVLNLKLYFINRAGKRAWLDGRKVDIYVDQTKPDETHTQWLQFDVSKAIKMAIDDKRLKHVVLELQCNNCKRIGARILNDAFNTATDALADDPFTEGHQLMPVLNIIGHFDQSHGSMRPHKNASHHDDDPQEDATTQRHYHHQTYNNNNNNNSNNNKNRYNRRTNCYKANQRCCRHTMEVTFKEIKGFEFIIQPKVFDAGYCHGRCPPRYNPAHHHAMLQSLIWKQNHHKAPRPCCAPSKLVELEVLHVDEKDSEKLKISTWSDMKVVECACS